MYLNPKFLLYVKLVVRMLMRAVRVVSCRKVTDTRSAEIECHLHIEGPWYPASKMKEKKREGIRSEGRRLKRREDEERREGDLNREKKITEEIKEKS